MFGRSTCRGCSNVGVAPLIARSFGLNQFHLFEPNLSHHELIDINYDVTYLCINRIAGALQTSSAEYYESQS